MNWEYPSLNTAPIKIGKGKNECALIIPFFNEFKLLEEHLQKLHLQTTNKFDLVLSAENLGEENVKKIYETISNSEFSFGAVILLSKGYGAAGAYFLGEQYAIKNGYKYIILADVDSYPIDRDLIENLMQKAGETGSIVIPHTLLTSEGATVKTRCFQHYGIIPVKTIREAGLHFSRLFIGGDDTEYLNRLKRVSKIEHIEKCATHPLIFLGQKNFWGTIVYSIHHILFTFDTDIATYFYTSAILPVAFTLFARKPFSKSGLVILKSIILYKYGKELINSCPAKPVDRTIRESEFDIVFSPVKISGNHNQKKYVYAKGVFGKVILATNTAIACFRKKVLLKQANLISVIFSGVVSKELWAYTKEGKAYYIFENKNPIIHAMKIATLTISMPVLILFSVLALPLLLIRRPKTKKYGVC